MQEKWKLKFISKILCLKNRNWPIFYKIEWPKLLQEVLPQWQQEIGLNLLVKKSFLAEINEKIVKWKIKKITKWQENKRIINLELMDSEIAMIEGASYSKLFWFFFLELYNQAWLVWTKCGENSWIFIFRWNGATVSLEAIQSSEQWRPLILSKRQSGQVQGEFWLWVCRLVVLGAVCVSAIPSHRSSQPRCHTIHVWCVVWD